MATSHYETTKARIFQWIGIVLVLAVFAGAYWYFQVRASTVNAPQNDSLTSGLVGLWSLNGDDISGTTAYDRSGSGNNGTLTNGPTKVPGKLGQALSFDGTNDYVTVPDSASLDVGTAVTYSVWMKTTATTYPSGTAHIFRKTQFGAEDKSLSLTYGGVINFYLYNVFGGSALTASSQISINTWVNIVGWYDGSTAKIYVNGVEVATKSASGDVADGTGAFEIGATGGENYFPGLIDELRVYNRALSAGEIQSLYALGQSDKMNSSVSQPQGTGRLDSGLAGYWKLDENTGTSAGDSSTNGNTGTLTNGPTWTTGQIGSAVDFDGTDDYVTTPDADVLDVTDSANFTLSGWFNRDTFTTDDAILSKRLHINPGYAGYILYIDDTTDKLTFEASDGTDEYQLESASTFVSTGWNYYSIVWDDSGSGQTKLYINGTAEAATSTGTFTNVNSMANAVPFSIGGYINHVDAMANPFDGKLDEIRIYNRALSADEVSQLYRLTTPTGVDTGLKGYWSFNGQDMNGTAAYDRSGAGNNGTLTNGPTKVPGKLGQGLNFDGSDDYISPASTLTTGTTFTLAMWVKPNAQAASYGALINQSDGSSNPGLMYRGSGAGGSVGKVSYFYSGADHLNTTALTNGVWNYVVVVVTAGNLQFYLNGATDGTASSVISLNLNRIGNDVSGEAFKGSLDEVRIYNRALSAAEIQSLYALGQSDKVNSAVSQPQGTGRLDSGLAGYWKLDENTGTSAGDASTNGNTGTLTNGPTWTTGQIGSAASFDNSNDYITVGNPSNGSLDPSLITVTAWFKLNAVGDGSANASYVDELVSKDLDCCTDLGGYSLMSYGYGQPSKVRGLIRRNSNGALLSAMGTTSLSAGTWYHGAMVFDGTKITVYLNGIQDGVSSTITSDTIKASALPLFIGSVSSSGPAYVTNGAIDEVRIYNRALSADEVSQLYRLTAPTGVDTGLKGYWSFNGQDMSGTTAFDRSGAGNTGTLTNSPTKVPGKLGQALNFDGTNYVNAPASDTNFLGALTLNFWIKFTGASHTGVLSKGSNFTANSPFAVHLWSGGTPSFSRANASNFARFDSAGTIPSGWVMLTFTTPNGNIETTPTMYINGAPTSIGYTSIGSTGAATGDTNPIWLGKTSYSGYTGGMDEVRIYNRVLSAAEIAALYNSSR